MKIKSTMSFHLTPVRMVIIKKKTNNKCWFEDVEKRKPEDTVGGNVNWYSQCGNSMEVLKATKIEQAAASSNSAAGWNIQGILLTKGSKVFI